MSTIQIPQSAQEVSPDQFLEMLISRQRYERLDDVQRGYRGLKDSAGRWYVVHERELTPLKRARGDSFRI